MEGFTLKDFEDMMEEMKKQNPKDFKEGFVEDIGDGLYKLGGTIITNKAGLEDLDAAMKRETEKYFPTGKIETKW
jgi:hypothetical protein